MQKKGKNAWDFLKNASDISFHDMYSDVNIYLVLNGLPPKKKKKTLETNEEKGISFLSM